MALERYNKECMANSYRISSWLDTRGIDQETAKVFNLGFAVDGELAGRVTIPVYHPWSGFLMSISGRSIFPEKPKYLHISFPASRFLYGLPRQNKLPCIILVEGQIDVISLEQLGYYAYAILGTGNITPWQVGLIRRWTDKVILYGDNDDPGRKASGRWFKTLKAFGIDPIKGPYPSDSIKDPDELVREDAEFVGGVVRNCLRPYDPRRAWWA